MNKESDKKIRAIDIAMCGLFTAITVILSQISLPIGTVPINLAHVAIFLAAGLLGWKLGTISIVIFVMLGAFGLPVFSGFRGGVGVLFGATGGFIFGYILTAIIVGLLTEKFGISYKVIFPAMLLGWAATYIPGVIWFMIYTKSNLIVALSSCVLPFLFGDLFKTVLTAILIKRLKPLYTKILKISL